ncbi:MAG: twin-arginine translocase subunit TatC [Planctomycetes bacterium]|nr:twin-arginine translocase subunit TatC [Planctomycetota bacterium]
MVKLDDPAVRAALSEEALPRMSFGDHLDELRKRLIRSLVVIFVAIMAVMPFKTEVQRVVTEPYRIQWRLGFERWVDALQAQSTSGEFERVGDEEGPEFLRYCLKHRDAILSGEKRYKNILPQKTGYNVPYTLMAMNGLEDMFNWMFASILFAIVLASPVVVWQAWAFIAAGLYARERRLFYRYFPFMVGLVASGVAFGYFVVLPFSLGFLISLMDPDQIGAMLSVGQYFTLLFALTAAMGMVFQLPLVMVALQRVGLVTHAAFIKHWRITILVIFIAAALFTPPEPVSMLMTAAPMLGLYGIGLLLTAMGRKGEARFAAEAEAEA